MTRQTGRILGSDLVVARRSILKGAIAGAGLFAMPGLVAACGDDDDSGAEGGGGGSEVEVFSWWTGGGEAAGLDAMIEIWKQQHPNIKFTNAAVAGGAGTNAKAVLAQRLEADDPPDSFQGHAGAELSDYIKAGQLESLNSMYDDQKLNDVFPSQLIDQITVDGDVYSVPVNIHRANMLWYSPSVLDAAGVGDVPGTFDVFLTALDAVKTKGGATALSLAEQWTVKHLLETVLLARLGGDGWAELWTPDGDWSSADVTTALNDLKTLFGFTNSDFASLTWQDASKEVADGKAGFNVMGDWAAGYFIELKKAPETDFNWAAVPGTDGIYLWLSDSFTLPKGAPHRDNALLWLELCASKEGQDAFNPLKGSIPARKDADKSKYTGYLAYALDEWSSDSLAGSLTHGVVANNAWNTDIDGALGLFLSDKNVDKFQDALGTAHDTHAA